MSEALCACNRPIHDTAYRCTVCASDLRRSLADVVRVAGEAAVTIARLDAIQRHGIARAELGEDDGWHKGEGALYPTPMPYSDDRARRHDAAVMELVTWARHIAETRGATIPDGHPCIHDVCRSRLNRDRRPIPGPICAQATATPLGTLAAWLSDQLDWLRYRPEADEAWPAIADACDELESVVDTSAAKTLVGRCPCETWLYAHKGATAVRCEGCGTSYDTLTARDNLHVSMLDRPVTASEAAHAAVYLDVIPNTGRLRKMIWDWCDRGFLAPLPHPEPPPEGYDGATRYRLGDVIDRLLTTVAARAA